MVRCLVTAKHARALATFAALAGALLVPGIGRGGTATLIDGQVRYKAAPGEANRVLILFIPGEASARVAKRRRRGALAERHP